MTKFQLITHDSSAQARGVQAPTYKGEGIDDLGSRKVSIAVQPDKALDVLISCLEEANTSRWHQLGKVQRQDGIVVDVAFGAYYFLGGSNNADLNNVIRLFRGEPLEALRGSLRQNPLSDPSPMSKCLAYPLLVRAIVPASSIADPGELHDYRVDTLRERRVESLTLSLTDVIAVRAFGLQGSLWNLRHQQLKGLTLQEKSSRRC